MRLRRVQRGSADGATPVAEWRPDPTASIGVLTGALAGGLDNRSLIRHLAIFPEDT